MLRLKGCQDGAIYTKLKRRVFERKVPVLGFDIAAHWLFFASLALAGVIYHALSERTLLTAGKAEPAFDLKTKTGAGTEQNLVKTAKKADFVQYDGSSHVELKKDLIRFYIDQRKPQVLATPASKIVSVRSALDRGEIGEAEALLRNVLFERPAALELVGEQVILQAYYRKDSVAALTALRKALELDFNIRPLMALYTELVIRTQSYPEALGFLQKLKASHEKGGPVLDLAIGAIWCATDKRKQGIEKISSVVAKLDELDRIEAYRLLAAAYEKEGLVRSSLEALLGASSLLDSFIQQHLDAGEPLELYGMTLKALQIKAVSGLFERGEWEQGEKLLTKLVGREPDDPQVVALFDRLVAGRHQI
jgi:tetratricopeptide (TPR) repeat protein